MGNKKEENERNSGSQTNEKAGVRISIGLSAIGNRAVTFAEGYSSDLWLHARDVPGSHVMLRGLPPGKKTG
jgi:predicted ribosome quality control (RQC) complex YloA/Tae2 family protein